MKSIQCLFRLLVVMSVCVYSSLQAQNIGGGLVLGFNASQIDGDRFGGFQKAGLQLGGFVNYAFSEQVGLQPEILFEQLGSANEQMLLLKMSYISVPILLNFTLPIIIGENEHQIQFHLGPVIGIMLSATDDFGFDFSRTFDNPDLRGVLGIAYRLGGISLSVRYGYSLLAFTPSNSNVGLLQPGANGLFHNYASFSLRWHLFD